jgi:hypothetical protein
MYENEKDITEKILNYNRAIAIINQKFKPNLVKIHTRTRVYKILA